MHMHTHLKSCTEDYGPCHAFWLYAFERYNGVLGSFPNNKRNIEVQLMDRFTGDNNLLCTPLPTEFRDGLEPHFVQRKLVGSAAETIQPHSSVTNPSTSEWSLDSNVILPTNRSRYILDSAQLCILSGLYSKLYPTASISTDIPAFCWKYRTIKLNGKHLGSFRSRSKSSSCVLAVWRNYFFGPPVTAGITLPTDQVRAARIELFLLHRITIDDKYVEHLLVSLSCFMYHPQLNCKGKPITVWCPDLFEPLGVHSLVPVQLIDSRAVSYVYSHPESLATPGESACLSMH